MSASKQSIGRSRLEVAYDALLAQHPDHWYAAVGDDLIHSDNPTVVAEELRRRGIPVGEVLVARAPGAGPYLVL